MTAATASALAPSETHPAAPATDVSLALLQPDSNRGYHVEHDARSEATASPTSRSTGADLVFAYVLAGGPPSGQFAALAFETTSHLIDGSNRISFRASSDRPTRMSVQVRQPGVDGDGDRWRRSVYVDPEPREVTVFSDDMRPVAPTSPSHPDLSKADAVLVVVDTANTRPGTAGQVWLKQVRLEKREVK